LEQQEPTELNPGWSVDPELFEYVKKLVPPPATVLELGSGASTLRWASLGYKVITIEHDQAFVKPNTNRITYVYAPIEPFGPSNPQLPSTLKRIPDHTGWYNRDAVAKGLRDVSYDCIVVDGPTGDIGRSGFFANLNLFPRLDVPILFDDQHRLDDLYIALRVATRLGRDLLITNNGETPVAQKPNGDWKAEAKKPFGVVLCR
jgi:hypothetical protein